MTSFRFLHAADIHLDSPLHGLSRYEGLPAEEVRGATRAAFDNLIACALDEPVDFVVIAGDLFDGDWKDMGTGLYFARAMGRLSQAGIPAFVLAGNHDAASAITKSLPWPERVHVFGPRRGETVSVPGLDVAIHGRSFPTPHVTENLAADYPDPAAGSFNIGMLHTALEGHPAHAHYAPCTVQQLQAKGYDYWALGHVHDFAQVSEVPPIVFPGNLQGRNIRETGPKGAVLVEVEEGIVSELRRLELDVLRWGLVEIDCGGAADWEEVERRARDALASAHERLSDGRPLIVRTTLSGQTDAAGLLLDRQSQLRDDLRALAAGISPELWIERVRMQVQQPSLAGTVEGADDLLALLAEVKDDPAVTELLAKDLGDFLLATPAPDDAEASGLSASARAGDWAPVAAAAAAALRARLERGEG